MGLSMAQLRSETLQHLGIDATDLDASGSTNLDLLINRSWWDLLDRYEFKEKEKTATVATVAGTRDYLIQTIIGSDIFEAIKLISILGADDEQHSLVDMISIQEYESRYNEQEEMRQIPTHYLHYGTNIRVYPTPDDIYTITVYYKYILTDLSATTPSIPQSWHESILYGAVSRGHLRARDYNAAEFMRRQQAIEEAKRSTTVAKEDKENKFAGVEVMRNPYSVSR
jgi:hypothetical protein